MFLCLFVDAFDFSPKEFPCISVGKSKDICRLLFLGTGLVAVNQSHGVHDHQIVSKLRLSRIGKIVTAAGCV